MKSKELDKDIKVKKIPFSTATNQTSHNYSDNTK